MPKSVKNIFLSKLTFRKMYEAYKRASKGKHDNKEVIEFEMNLRKKFI